MGRKGDPYATDTLLSLIADLPTDLRERDLLTSVGEVISAVVVAHELRSTGIDAIALTGPEAGILTDGIHDRASITELHTGPIESLLSRGAVPVVCGFQGMSASGAITTLGRGGSDTTACALGVALGAEEVEIYTDVDGVMTADPRTCQAATVLEVIRADELFQMARAGSRVVHTPAAEMALASGLAVRVRSTYSDHPGTRVSDIGALRPDVVATAVTCATDIVRLRVDLLADEGSDANMRAQARVYRALADASVSLDMFTPVGHALVFTVSAEALGRAKRAVDALRLPCELTPDLAKVTVVGAGMHGVPGVVARAIECLSNAGVSVLQTADSHTTISVLIPGGDARTAVSALHDGFNLSTDATT